MLSGATARDPWKVYRSKRPDSILPICNNTPHVLRDLLSLFRSRLHRACIQAHEKHKGNYKYVTNSPKYVNAAWQWLSSHSYVVAPTDKDGGFCIAPLQCTRDVLLSKLRSSGYALLPSHAVPIRGAMISMQRALKNFGALHSDDFYKHFWSQIRSVPSSRLLCPLHFTIKTHKPVPSVRLIHSGGQHFVFPYNGLRRCRVQERAGKLHACV